MRTNTGSSLAALVRRGKSLAQLGWRIIDAHAHLGPYGGFFIPSPDAASVVSIMDRVGIGATAISPHLAIASDYRLGNDLCAQVVELPGPLCRLRYVEPAVS